MQLYIYIIIYLFEFFICHSGEVKVIVDPQLHKTQYSKLFEQEEFNINSDKPKAVVPEEVDEEQSRFVVN